MPAGLSHKPEAEPSAASQDGPQRFQVWMAGESNLNSPNGYPFSVAVLRDTFTGKERPFIYDRAFGFDNVARAHLAKVVEPPAER